MKRAKVLLLILFLALIKDIVWTITVPVFETPDEQAHFAQLQYVAENRTLNIPSQNNLSLEVATVENLLGTRRDDFGNNKFTYHPEYTTPESVVIPSFPKSARTQYVDGEAAGYPPLYYLAALPFYQRLYDSNLVDRLFAARLVSIVCGLVLAVVAYKIGGWTLAILVSFQPMVSFVAAGFHPDNLLNLIYSLAVLVCYLILKNGLSRKYLLYLAVLIFLGLKTKILMVFFLPVAASVIIYQLFRKRKAGILLSLLVLIAPIVAFLLLLPLPYMPLVTPNSPLVSMTFLDYLRFRGPKLAFEIWPWYWGVFKWLGVTLSPAVLKIITRVAAVATLGIGFYLAKKVIRKRFDFEFKLTIFFLISTFSYLLYLVFWDYRLMQSVGYSAGLQGRYLLTNIIPQMALFYLGARLLLKRFVIILPILMILLNIIALFTVARSYYDFSSLQSFLHQYTLNKPGIVAVVTGQNGN